MWCNNVDTNTCLVIVVWTEYHSSVCVTFRISYSSTYNYEYIGICIYDHDCNYDEIMSF